MPTKDNIPELHSYHGRQGCVISLYTPFDDLATLSKDLQWLAISTSTSNFNTERFTTLCRTVGKFPRFEEFSLYKNNLGILDIERFKALGMALGECHRLQELDLSDNRLGVLDFERFKTLGEALGKCSQLQRLNLSRNYLGISNVYLYAEILDKRPQESWDPMFPPKRLYRAGQCKISVDDKSVDDRLAALDQLLSKCPQLQELDLSNNDLYELGVKFFNVLGKSIGKCSQLKELNLSGNDLYRLSDDDEYCDALNTFISKCSQLQRLILDDSFLFDYRLSAVLACHENLEIIFNHKNKNVGLTEEFCKIAAGLNTSRFGISMVHYYNDSGVQRVRNWREVYTPLLNSTQDEILGSDSAFHFLGVTLPSIADLTFPEPDGEVPVDGSDLEPSIFKPVAKF